MYNPDKGYQARQARVTELPYGIGTCPDGREVLYNRRYEPLWQREPGGRPERVYEQPATFVKREWFYNDGTTDVDRFRRGNAVLKQWGLMTVIRTPIPCPRRQRPRRRL